MGILVLMEDKSWIVSICEKWYFESLKDLESVLKTLTSLRIPFFFSSFNNHFVIEFINAQIRPKDKKSLSSFLDDLLSWKEKYGHKEKVMSLCQ